MASRMQQRYDGESQHALRTINGYTPPPEDQDSDVAYDKDETLRIKQPHSRPVSNLLQIDDRLPTYTRSSVGMKKDRDMVASNTEQYQDESSQISSRPRPDTSRRSYLGASAVSPKSQRFPAGNRTSIHRFSPPSGTTGYQDRSYAASAHPLDRPARTSLTNANGFMDAAPTIRHTSRFEDNMSRRQSLRTAQPRPTTVQRSYSRDSHSPSRRSYTGETEVSVSTVAPSTVWDELDDLKSRIKRIELSKTTSASTTETYASIEEKRPITAETGMTSLSSGARRQSTNDPQSPEDCDDSATDLHPLLQVALSQLKALNNRRVYDPLEAAANDARTLAAMTASRSHLSHASASMTNGAVNRQIRRKADAMCRNLTDLCIALAEEDSHKKSLQAASERDAALQHKQARRASYMPPQNLHDISNGSIHSDSARIQDRFAARRASLGPGRAYAASSPWRPRPAESEATTPGTVVEGHEGDVAQNAFMVGNRYDTRTAHDGAAESNSLTLDTQTAVSARPVSRAATEAGHNYSPHRNFVREHYLSARGNSPSSRQSPQLSPSSSPSRHFPNPSSSTPFQRSNFPAFTGHASNSQYSGPLSRSNTLAGSRFTMMAGDAQAEYSNRESTTPQSTDAERLAKARQRRLSSMSHVKGQSRYEDETKASARMSWMAGGEDN